MADPVTAEPDEARLAEPLEPGRAVGALRLLGDRDFRRTYLAISASELGNAFHYIALMWFALEAGGPLGVVAVRLADSVPALLFGFHGGLVADRFDRRRLMIAADVVRAATLVPVAVAGLSGDLPLWALVVAAFVMETAANYFEPAYGAFLPSLVRRENVQRANALVRATDSALGVGGWALAAVLLAFLPLSTFFAANAVSFAVSALLLAGVASRSRTAAAHEARPRIREGFAALRPLPMLAAAVAAIGLAVTVTAGTWIAGVPQLVSKSLGEGAGGFSLVMVGYALGAIAGGAVLARRQVRRKALGSLLAWCLYLPAYALLALAGSLPVAAAGAFFAGIGQSSAVVLAYSAAQEDVPDEVLGRVTGLISLFHRGAHATGLVLVAPLFAVFDAQAVFAAAACVVPLIGLGAATAAARRTPAPARAPSLARDR
ncbi:MAG TPA: MFS transporter [Gaiellaceae bacterium]|nr:MFS transporter [Gaiellaceae bacterium]